MVRILEKTGVFDGLPQNFGTTGTKIVYQSKKSLEDEKGQIRAYLLNTSNNAGIKKVWKKYH